MRSHGCVNGTLDEAIYSSPMPVIGLYVAAATSVCSLLMLIDIFAGFREKKRWIPCRFFPLNSVTLTLVAIATKLPVDLTTPMPRALDQLSKLTGTVLVCIYMGFLMPSLGITRKSECLSNMISLSIFVITVFVNVCIQMHTGVIFLFRAEHITVLFCMMFLLLTLWVFTSMASTRKEISTDYIKEHFANGWGSLLRRLKACYLLIYDSDPQYVLCKKLICPFTCVISIICAAILVPGIIKSFVLKEVEFCGGTSDYGWSMWAIVGSQVITILVGCLGTIFRLVTMAEHVKEDDHIRSGSSFKFFGGGFDDDSNDDYDVSRLQNRVLSTFIGLIRLVVLLIGVLAIALHALVAVPVKGIRKARESDEGGCLSIRKPNDEVDDTTTKFKELVRTGEMGLDVWTLKNGVKDMERWIDPVNKIEFSNHLIQLLSKTPPSQDSLTSLHQNPYDPAKRRHIISSLSMIVLSKIATIFVPSAMLASLFNSLDEVSDVIHYVDRKVISSTHRKFIVAKAKWANKAYFPRYLKWMPRVLESPLQLDQALQKISILKGELYREDNDVAKKEVATIIDFIEQKSFTSVEELYNDIQQLFVDMLNEFLAQLPGLIFKDVIESAPEDLEEKVKFGLKMVYKIEALGTLIQWSFPLGTTITNLISDEVAAAVPEKRTTPETKSNSSRDVTDACSKEILKTENQTSLHLEGSHNIGDVLQSIGEEEASYIV